MEQDWGLTKLNEEIIQIRDDDIWPRDLHEIVPLQSIPRRPSDDRVIENFERHDIRIICYEHDQTFHIHIPREHCK
jgi:hypothetical protein